MSFKEILKIQDFDLINTLKKYKNYSIHLGIKLIKTNFSIFFNFS